jgi:hypothetical protein
MVQCRQACPHAIGVRGGEQRRSRCLGLFRGRRESLGLESGARSSHRRGGAARQKSSCAIIVAGTYAGDSLRTDLPGAWAGRPCDLCALGRLIWADAPAQSTCGRQSAATHRLGVPGSRLGHDRDEAPRHSKVNSNLDGTHGPGLLWMRAAARTSGSMSRALTPMRSSDLSVAAQWVAQPQVLQV